MTDLYSIKYVNMTIFIRLSKEINKVIKAFAALECDKSEVQF